MTHSHSRSLSRPCLAPSQLPPNLPHLSSDQPSPSLTHHDQLLLLVFRYQASVRKAIRALQCCCYCCDICNYYRTMTWLSNTLDTIVSNRYKIPIQWHSDKYITHTPCMPRADRWPWAALPRAVRIYWAVSSNPVHCHVPVPLTLKEIVNY